MSEFGEAVNAVLQRAADLGRAGVVATIEAQPGWRACIVERSAVGAELKLVPIVAWGLRSGLPMFGQELVHRPGRGPGVLIPIGGDGAPLDGTTFAGIAGPGDTNEAIQKRFEEIMGA